MCAFSLTHPTALRCTPVLSAATCENAARLRSSSLLASPTLPDSWQLAFRHEPVTLAHMTDRMGQMLSKGGFGWGLWLFGFICSWSPEDFIHSHSFTSSDACNPTGGQLLSTGRNSPVPPGLILFLGKGILNNDHSVC